MTEIKKFAITNVPSYQQAAVIRIAYSLCSMANGTNYEDFLEQAFEQLKSYAVN